MLSSGLVINNRKHDNVLTLQLNNNRSSVCTPNLGSPLMFCYITDLLSNTYNRTIWMEIKENANKNMFQERILIFMQIQVQKYIDLITENT